MCAILMVLADYLSKAAIQGIIILTLIVALGFLLRARKLEALMKVLERNKVPECFGNCENPGGGISFCVGCIKWDKACLQATVLLSKRHKKCELVPYLVSDYQVVRELARVRMRNRFFIWKC